MLAAETLDELKDGLLTSYAQLQNLGIFSSLEFLADAGPDVRSLPSAGHRAGLSTRVQTSADVP